MSEAAGSGSRPSRLGLRQARGGSDASSSSSSASRSSHTTHSSTMSNIPKTCKAWILKEKPGEQVTDKVRSLSPLTSRALFPAYAGPAPRWPATTSQQQQADLYLRSHPLHRLAADVRPRGARGARARRRRDPCQDRLLLQRPGPAVRLVSLVVYLHHDEEPADAELAAAPGSRTRSSRCVLVRIRTSSARSSLTSSTKLGARLWALSR